MRGRKDGTKHKIIHPTKNGRRDRNHKQVSGDRARHGTHTHTFPDKEATAAVCHDTFRNLCTIRRETCSCIHNMQKDETTTTHTKPLQGLSREEFIQHDSRVQADKQFCVCLSVCLNYRFLFESTRVMPAAGVVERERGSGFDHTPTCYVLVYETRNTHTKPKEKRVQFWCFKNKHASQKKKKLMPYAHVHMHTAPQTAVRSVLGLSASRARYVCTRCTRRSQRAEHHRE